MKKIIISLVFSLFVTMVHADHEKKDGDVYFQQIPSLCSTPDKIQAYLDHMSLKPFHISLGREGMKKDGQPVYMITYLVNEETGENAAVIDVPSGMERCLLFHTFNVTSTLN